VKCAIFGILVFMISKNATFGLIVDREYFLSEPAVAEKKARLSPGLS